MPTVFICQGICVIVYVKDHPPPHVHAKTGSGEVVIFLGEDGVSRYVPASDMSKSDVRKAVNAVEDRLAECWTMWKRYHP
jgi:hypothetical protein